MDPVERARRIRAVINRIEEMQLRREARGVRDHVADNSVDYASDEADEMIGRALGWLYHAAAMVEA